jgi:hypothetical protein
VLVGAIAAAVLFAALWHLWLSRRHARRSEARLGAKLEKREREREGDAGRSE